ncbi:hypothetical protein D4R86_03005 [bacterium]|nr:MAG: hypothetical protein D4R86_03005 [bacterium]
MKPYTQMNSKELLKDLNDSSHLAEAEDILHEAYKKNYYPVLESAAKNAVLMEMPELSGIIFNYILLKSNSVGKNLLYILLNHPNSNISKYSFPVLTNICLKGDVLPAVALLAKNTPSNIVAKIINEGSLYNAGYSPFYTTNESMASELMSQSPILTEMMKLLQHGWKWENESSGLILSSRIAQTPGDKFITMASSYDLSTPIASSFIYSLDEDALQNRQAFENLSKNENKEVKLTMLLNKFNSSSNNQQLILSLIEHISKGIDNQELMWLWQYVTDRMSKNPHFNPNLLFSYKKGAELMKLFAKSNIGIATSIIKLLISWVSQANLPKTSYVEEIIDFGLNTPSLQELTLTIPKDAFDRISLTSQHRQLVENKYSLKEPEDEYLKQIKNIFANKKTNWYQKHSEATSIIIQEAGWKENLSTVLIASLVLILGGSTVKNASDKMKVKEEQVIAAMNDSYLMEQAKQIARTDHPQMTEPVKESMPYVEKMNNEVDSFTKMAFDYIKGHEGLKLMPYYDTEENMTIGIGHRILPNEDFSKGITEDEALSLFQKDLHTHIDRTKRLFPSFDSYPNIVKSALLDGVFRGDHKAKYKTTHLINNGQWIPASKEYLVNNDYYKSKYGNENAGVHIRMEENSKIMAQYGKALK